MYLGLVSVRRPNAGARLSTIIHPRPFSLQPLVAPFSKSAQKAREDVLRRKRMVRRKITGKIEWLPDGGKRHRIAPYAALDSESTCHCVVGSSLGPGARQAHCRRLQEPLLQLLQQWGFYGPCLLRAFYPP